MEEQEQLYTCDFNCGFGGVHATVLRHEKRCSRRPRACEDCQQKTLCVFGLPAEGETRWCAECAKSHPGAAMLADAPAKPAAVQAAAAASVDPAEWLDLEGAAMDPQCTAVLRRPTRTSTSAPLDGTPASARREAALVKSILVKVVAAAGGQEADGSLKSPGNMARLIRGLLLQPLVAGCCASIPLVDVSSGRRTSQREAHLTVEDLRYSGVHKAMTTSVAQALQAARTDAGAGGLGYCTVAAGLGRIVAYETEVPNISVHLVYCG
jgi:hypothetical protein